MRENEIPILILSDSRGTSHISIEPSVQKDGSIRLFREFSGSRYSFKNDELDNLRLFLDSQDASDVLFEDTRTRIMRKMLRRIGYKKASEYKALHNLEIKLSEIDPGISRGMQLFGTSPDSGSSNFEKMRHISMFRNGAAIGEVALTDFGLFVRAKANRFGSEGYAVAASREEMPEMLLSVVLQLRKEGKRYLILGEEYSEYTELIHPYPLWRMSLSRQKKYDHECRVAKISDWNVLAKLISEYEDAEISSVYERLTKRLASNEYRYLLTPGNEGFALIKFMEGAKGMINDLYVSPQHQAKGLGDELTRGCISHLSESCIGMHLNTIYPRARRLYEKYGFKVDYTDLSIALNQKRMTKPNA